MQIIIHAPSICEKIAFRSVNEEKKPEKELINTMYSIDITSPVTTARYAFCIYFLFSLMYLVCAPTFEFHFAPHFRSQIFFFFPCTLFNFFFLFSFFMCAEKNKGTKNSETQSVERTVAAVKHIAMMMVVKE